MRKVALLSSAISGVANPPSGPMTLKTAAHSLRVWVTRHREVIWVLLILAIAGLAHGINMFNFPYYENDEGTYMSQAWSVIEQGRLAPYTYWYDHAPVGWIQIAAWSWLTGGFHTFETVVDSGRVLMLLMQLASTFMVYRIARNISGSMLVATIASLAFALSAYGIYFHRRVLLDNIATFWMLMSILPLVSGRLSLKRVWFSAFALAISILSKEVIIFVLPVLAYLVFYRAHKMHRGIATIGWLAIIGFIVSLYVLMATLKNELFPMGTLLGGMSRHVSLLGTLQFQACRGKDGGILDFGSGFWTHTQSWVWEEPFLVIGGSIAALFAVLAIKRYRLAGIMGLASFSLWAFLGRGGEVIGFYLIPLLPLLALNVGLIIGSTANWLNRCLRKYNYSGLVVGRGMQTVALVLGVGLAGLGYIASDLGFQNNRYTLWNNGETEAQRQALDWVKENLSPEDKIITDNYLWTDLHDPKNNGKGFSGTHYYWKVDQDPEIRDDVFDKDWRNADYVVSTFQMEHDARNNGLGLVSSALTHSTPITTFNTGGSEVAIRQVNKNEAETEQPTSEGDIYSPQKNCELST